MKLGVKRLIAVSQDLANYIEERGLFNKSNIRVIYNGVDVDKYGKNSLTDIRRQLRLSDDTILVGSVGNIRPAKAYNILIEAAATVIKHNPLVHFVIAGHKKPELMAQLDDQINRNGIGSNIHFVGFQQDSAAFLGQMDLFALSSSSEGFSISTIEAMATGLAVIVTRCGGPEEIVSHGENGLMVAANDAGALANGIVQLLNDIDLKKHLSNSGQNHVRLTFAMDKLLTSYQSEYLSLLSH